MFESLSQRTVIIGNSGAGKSALAESLAALVHVPVNPERIGVVMIAPRFWIARRNGASFSNAKCVRVSL